MPSENLQVGQLVSSKAGRDKDHFYVIFKLIDQTFVEVVDGVSRSLQHPKKKNIKHLQTYGQYSNELTEDTLGRLTDADVRREIGVLVSRL